MFTCCLDVASVPSATSADEAIEALAHAGWQLALAGERLDAGSRWPTVLAHWGERCWLAGRGPGPHPLPAWNLAATDEDVRGRAVREALERLREAATRGASHHVLSAGWAVSGHPPAGEPVTLARAFDQLSRSLDVLAELADARGLKISIVLGKEGNVSPLGTRWEDVQAVVARVAAPPLGVMLDLEALLVRADRADAEPTALLGALLPLVHSLRLATKADVLRDPDHAIARLLRGLPSPPPVMVLAPGDVRGQTLRELREGIEALGLGSG
jgi:sugar phosphate isomerase/epimerase